MSHSGWLKETVDPLRMARAVKVLEQFVQRDKPDFIAVRGISGTVMGGALMLSTGVKLAIVRKPNDGTHSGYNVEHALYSRQDKPPLRYVIVDDLISTGSTVEAIREAIGRELKAECVAIYLYHSDRDEPYCGIPVKSMGL